MAKAPKNELAVKAAIADLVTKHTNYKNKSIDTVRIRNKSYTYLQDSCLGNLAIQSELLSLWLIIPCKLQEDFTAFENAIHTAQNPAFNGLQIVAVKEAVIENNWQRYYEIKVN